MLHEQVDSFGNGTGTYEDLASFLWRKWSWNSSQSLSIRWA
jgi:hypothetical protein